MQSRRILFAAGLMAAGLLASLPVQADNAKKTVPTPGWENNPTVGVFGAHPHHDSGPGGRPAAPPPPSAAGSLPKVQVESTMPEPPLPSAVPRPQAAPEGGPAALPYPPAYGSHSSASHPSSMPPAAGMGAPAAGMAPPPALPPPAPTGFLADHPVISGLVAGLIGTDLGERLYGGPMSGSETAAMAGFGARVLLVVLLMIGLVRLLWRAVGGSPAPMPDYGAPPRRREPSFGGKGDSRGDGDNRREPGFHRDS